MPISRGKACEPCRLAKARCSLDPVCLRCSNRGLECKYTGGSWRSSPFIRPHFPGPGRNPSLASPPFSTEPLSSLLSRPASRLSTPESAGIIADEFALSDTQAYNWDSYLVDDSRSMTWGQPFLNKAKGPSLSQSTNFLRHEGLYDAALDFVPPPMSQYDSIGGSPLKDPQTDIVPVVTTKQFTEAATTEKRQQGAGSSSAPRQEDEDAVGIDNEATIGIYVKRYEHLVTHRGGLTSERSLTAKILLGQIETFPKMLIRGSRLPPLIYPQCVLNNRISRCCTAANGTHQCLLEPLANCAVLTRTFYDRNPSNAQFIWKAMYDEQRRLYEEVSDHAFCVASNVT